MKKKSNTIPDWFDLKKYQRSKDFEPIDWYFALANRSELISIAESYKRCGRTVEFAKESNSVAVQNFLTSLDDPLSFDVYRKTQMKPGFFDIPPICEIETRLIHGLGQIVSEERGHYTNLHSSHENDGGVYDKCEGFSRHELFSDYVKDKSRKIKKAVIDPSNSKYVPFISLEKYSFLMIDHTLSKKTLMKVFEKYLDDQKGLKNNLKRPSYLSSLDKLFSYRVLPLLDIYAWECLKGVKLDQEKILLSIDVTDDEYKDKIERHVIMSVSDAFLSDLSAYLNLS
ncbi:MAG: DUF6387 family protein [Paraglaciecola chathamensis]|uniref:DUF6387 family protein n=1 Tax=Neptunomonas TaxID=75687 RepID=UPI003512B12B